MHHASLRKNKKEELIQIRISKNDKMRLVSLARVSRMTLTAWIESRILPTSLLDEWMDLYQETAPDRESKRDITAQLARLNDLLMKLHEADFRQAIAVAPRFKESADMENKLLFRYISAMIDQACKMRGIEPPSWMDDRPVIEPPFFSSNLSSLRLYLLLAAPVAFRKKSIFVDTTLGGRV
jgi:hypothetical protein